ncbi:MAG: hypothetical protein IPI67_22345 [Myxococcales bacterium]|nr:hypothetical protein [Myxococcales bacterium]
MRVMLSELPEAVCDSEGIRALEEHELAAGLKATSALRERLPRLESALRRSRGRFARGR